MEYSQLEEKIRQVIRANGSGLITGTNLQEVMLDVLDFANTHGGGDGPKVVHEVTYQELVTLRNNSELVEGDYYRITDYTCTVKSDEDRYSERVSIANHPFDIVLKAESFNSLSEEATAALHDGDTYFAKCDLSKWKLWYSIDNNVNRFGWADEVSGKGVIYRMIDEWGNDCPYDFKNMLFSRYALTEDYLSLFPDQFATILRGSRVCSRQFAPLYHSLPKTVDTSKVTYFYTFSVIEQPSEYDYPKVVGTESIHDLSVAIYEDARRELSLDYIKTHYFGNNRITPYEGPFDVESPYIPLDLPMCIFINYWFTDIVDSTEVLYLASPLVNSVLDTCTDTTVFVSKTDKLENDWLVNAPYVVKLKNDFGSLFYTQGLFECRDYSDNSLIWGNHIKFEVISRSLLDINDSVVASVRNFVVSNIRIINSIFEGDVSGINMYSSSSSKSLALKVLSGIYSNIRDGKVDLSSYNSPDSNPSLYIGISPTNNQIKAWIPGDNPGIDYNGVNSGGLGGGVVA